MAKETTKILIIEDDPALLKALREKFELENFSVCCQPDGASAVDSVCSFQPQVILLDVMLPHNDGFSILKQIKSDAKYKDIPVVILTNLSQEGDKDFGLSLGASAYLVKADNFLTQIVKTVRDQL